MQPNGCNTSAVEECNTSVLVVNEAETTTASSCLETRGNNCHAGGARGGWATTDPSFRPDGRPPRVRRRVNLLADPRREATWRRKLDAAWAPIARVRSRLLAVRAEQARRAEPTVCSYCR